MSQTGNQQEEHESCARFLGRIALVSVAFCLTPIVIGCFYYLPLPFVFPVVLIIFLRSRNQIVREVTGAMLLALTLLTLALWYNGNLW